MERAKLISRHRNLENKGTDLVYSYRGHEYMITAYGWGGCSDTLAQQHRTEQHRIDQIIEQENRPQPEGPTVDEVMDAWLAYMNS